MVFSLYPRSLQFAEQLRQTDVPGFVSILGGVDSQRIGDKTLARPCSPDQDDIQSLADVAVICQAFQKIPVQMPVWQIFNVPKKGGLVRKFRILDQLFDLVVMLGIVFGIDQQHEAFMERQGAVFGFLLNLFLISRRKGRQSHRL